MKKTWNIKTQNRKIVRFYKFLNFELHRNWKVSYLFTCIINLYVNLFSEKSFVELIIFVTCFFLEVKIVFKFIRSFVDSNFHFNQIWKIIKAYCASQYFSGRRQHIAWHDDTRAQHFESDRLPHFYPSADSDRRSFVSGISYMHFIWEIVKSGIRFWQSRRHRHITRHDDDIGNKLLVLNIVGTIFGTFCSN